jgi:fatty acid amide hydrolase
MGSDDPTTLGALELARRIRAGQMTSGAVVEAHIERIQSTQARLNAVVIERFELARQEAKAADEARGRGAPGGPLHGVPITIKESFDVAGLATTAGVTAYRDRIAARDSPLVERLRKAGGVVLGKTNLAQLLWFLESDNPLYGRCNNPWDQERTPGGSSGGEAAVIAAGGSALGIGSDIGGSIRAPAHFCGIHGFKPTSGRLNPAGSIEDLIMPGQEAILSQAGPFARRVEDIDAAMGILLDDVVLGAPWQARELGRVSGLRVGVFEDNGYLPASPALRRAVREAAEALRERGAEVVPFEPPDPTLANDLYNRIMTADGARCLKRALRGSKADKRLKAMFFFIGMPGFARVLLHLLARITGQRYGASNLRTCGPFSADQYWQLIKERNEYKARFFAAMDRQSLDVLLCPPLSTVALRHGMSVDVVSGQSYLCPFNLLGMPAGVVAATRVRAGEESDRQASWDYVLRKIKKIENGSAGLPAGVQIAGRPHQDETVVAAMAAIEQGLSGKPDYPVRPPL